MKKSLNTSHLNRAYGRQRDRNSEECENSIIKAEGKKSTIVRKMRSQALKTKGEESTVKREGVETVVKEGEDAETMFMRGQQSLESTELEHI